MVDRRTDRRERHPHHAAQPRHAGQQDEAAVSDEIVAGMTFEIGWVAGQRDPTVGTLAAADGDIDYFDAAAPLAVSGNYINTLDETSHRPLNVTVDGYITVQNKTVISSANAGRITFLVHFEYIGND